MRDRTPDFLDVRQVFLSLSCAQIRHPHLGSCLPSLCFSRCICKGLRKLETGVQMVSKVRGTDEIRKSTGRRGEPRNVRGEGVEGDEAAQEWSYLGSSYFFPT